MSTTRSSPGSRSGRVFRKAAIRLLGLLLIAGLACSPAAYVHPTSTPTAIVTPVVSPTLQPTPPPPTQAPPTPLPPDTGWRELAPGLEQRTLRVMDQASKVLETMTLLRIVPATYQFDVLYTPGSARSVQQWAADSKAIVTLNAGFYLPEYLATGLLIVNGVRHGQSYDGFGGMLAVRQESVQVRSLSAEPYDDAESLRAAVQSFPVLIQPGGVLGFPEEDGITARRTVIAQDRTGSIIIAVCPHGSFTLHQLATFLLQSDLDLDTALNLDGGTSTGLTVRLGEEHFEIPSLVPVPAVITIRPKII